MNTITIIVETTIILIGIIYIGSEFIKTYRNNKAYQEMIQKLKKLDEESGK